MTGSNGYIPRYVDGEIDNLLKAFGAVQIQGPKYCGKTRTAMEHSASVFALDDTSNNYGNYRLAKLDPNMSLEGEEPHLIDEWQLVPSIWDSVRRDLDSDNRRGRFILCGSSTPEDVNGKNDGTPPLHSGFGRITSVRMRTMSLTESGDSDRRASLQSLFDGSVRTGITERRDLSWVIDRIMGGGWPGNLDLDPHMRALVVSRYPGDICDNDLPRVDASKSPSRMRRVLRSLARNESTMASNTTLSRDMKEFDDEIMKDSTVSDYVDVLRRMNLIEDQPAFSPNLRSSVRVGKTPKRHLTDPAIAVASLGLTKAMLMNDLNLLGFMFEGLCARDLQIYAGANGGKLYHYRDSAGREIDAVVELPDGRWGAFEVKLGAGQIDDAAENLLRIDNMIRNDPNGRPPNVLCVISGLEGAVYRREDGVYVVPIGSLTA